MKTRFLIILVTITIGVIAASTVGTMEYQKTYNQNCNSDGGKVVGFLRCIYINEDFDVPQIASDCRKIFEKGTPEMFECMEQFRDTTSIPSAQEFLKMDCEDLTHLFPEFPSEKVADAWNTRMHECINEQESLLLQTELEKWNEVGCLEILNNTEMDFEDNVDKRAFDIRWRQCLENEN